MREVIYICAGYLLGSILFARVAGQLFRCGDLTRQTGDQNPGAYNAFRNGGVACGVFTLAGDMLKGFLPVFLYQAGEGATENVWLWGLMLAAPVIGHIFPVFFGFHGGKGIATTFGCLLGLWPDWRGAVILAACFLFFTLVVRVTPNFHKTALTYLLAETLILLLLKDAGLAVGFTCISLCVALRLMGSKEDKSGLKAEVLWMH